MVDMHITKEMMQNATEVDYSCFDDSQFYDVYTRALSQASGAAQHLVGTYISIASNLISVLAIVSVMFAMISFEFIFIAIANVAISYIVITIQNKWQFKFNMKMTKLTRQLNYFSSLFFSQGMAKELRVFGSSPFFIGRFSTLKEESIKQTNQHLRRYHAVDYAKEIMFAATSFLTMLLVAVRIFRGGETIGIFVATINAVQSLTAQLQSLTGNVPSLYDQSRYINNLKVIADAPKAIESLQSGQIDLVSKSGYKVEFRNVSFKYPNSNSAVFDNLSFIISERERTCLVGENGAGKTTIVKLLLRLYDPQQGTILIDDVDIKTYSIKSLRSNFSVVFQDSQIYSMNVSENLHFSEDENLKPLTISALKNVGLYESFIHEGAFSDKPLTKMFEKNGAVLSGGQQQKLFVARAFMKEAGLVILDEPSSSLDPMAEYQLVDMLCSLAKQRTALVISHRLLLCQGMDKVIFIENGVVAESGSYQALIKLQGKYYEMYKTQADYYKDVLT